MPLQNCTNDEKSGFRWGSNGHCYTGPGAKKKAVKQGLSYDKEYFKQNATFEELDEMIGDLELDPLLRAELAIAKQDRKNDKT